MNDNRENKADLQEALDVLSLIYHHGPGEGFRMEIEKLDRDVPDWRDRIVEIRQEDQRGRLFEMVAWDRAIKLLFKRRYLR